MSPFDRLSRIKLKEESRDPWFKENKQDKFLSSFGIIKSKVTLHTEGLLIIEWRHAVVKVIGRFTVL